MTEKQLIQSIRNFNGDTSRTAEETLEGLENARDEILMLIYALEDK